MIWRSGSLVESAEAGGSLYSSFWVRVQLEQYDVHGSPTTQSIGLIKKLPQ